MGGELSSGDHIRQTGIGFRIFTDYELYINAIDQEYESEVAIFYRRVYMLSTPQFNLVKRSQFFIGCGFK